MLAEEWSRIIKNLARTVHEARGILDWSQQQLADRAVTSQGAISRVESGRMLNIPFHTVVVIGRAISAGMRTIQVSLPPSTMELLRFTQGMDGNFVDAVDPDIICLTNTFNRMLPKQRAIFMQFVRTTAELMSQADDSSISPVPPSHVIHEPEQQMPISPASYPLFGIRSS